MKQLMGPYARRVPPDYVYHGYGRGFRNKNE